MNVISRKILAAFWSIHSGAEKSMDEWYWKCRPEYWHNLAEVRAVFPSADPVRMSDGTVVTVFNVGGNKFRIITKINYQRFTMRITYVLTHKEYDRGQWKY